MERGMHHRAHRQECHKVGRVRALPVFDLQHINHLASCLRIYVSESHFSSRTRSERIDYGKHQERV